MIMLRKFLYIPLDHRTEICYDTDGLGLVLRDASTLLSCWGYLPEILWDLAEYIEADCYLKWPSSDTTLQGWF